MFKRVVLTSLIVIVATGLFAGYFYHVGKYTKEKLSTSPCIGVNVVVLDSLDNSLISASDVKKRISPWIDTSCNDSIDLHSIEMMVNSFGEVAHAEVFKSDYEHIRIELTQRKPAVRFISNGHSYYADSQGYLFPVYKSTDVPIVTGNIPIPDGTSFRGFLPADSHIWILGAIRLATFIESDSYWKNMIGQIDARSDGEFVLYTDVSGPDIVFGKAYDIPEKFKKLEAYYRNIVPAKGSKQYKTVTLKYNNLIICK